MGALIEPILWAQAEDDYVKGDESIAQLATRHGFAYSAVRNRALRHDWLQKRQDYRMEKAQKAAKTRDEFAPIPLPPEILALQTQQAPELGPGFWIEQKSAYYLKGLEDLDVMESAFKEQLYADKEAKVFRKMDAVEFNALVSAKAKLLDARRILLSIPTVGVIKPTIKNVKRPTGAITIDDEPAAESSGG